MTGFTFTADAATDQLTITAHGLLTGDGPAQAYNFDGTLAGGLTQAADTWIIRINANTVKLATSSANALAGTAINITTNGTGTHRLYVGLPTTRNRTYAAASQVASADLNALQDGLTGRRKGPFGRRFFPRLAYPGTTNLWVVAFQSCPTILSTGGTSAQAYVEIPYEPGDRVIGLHIQAFGDGAVDTQLDVQYQAVIAGGITTLSTTTDINRAAAFGKIIMPTFAAQVLVEDAVFFLKCSPTAANYQIGPCTAWFDRLS